MWRGTFVLVALLYPAAFIHVNGENSHIRHRRSWIMPGTLWCGAGSTAENFTNLGLFRGVDLCCREHDHCFSQIQAFEYQYGIRNYKLHTISHCDCDQSFRQCLYAANDTMSTLVGIMFFNILEMPCFTLREEEQCVEWHWWGGCKRNGSSPKAELQKPTLFNNSNTEDKQTPPHPHGSPPHKGKPSSLSLSSMNSVKSKSRLLKKLERVQTNAFVKGSGGITADRRGSEEAEKKRSHNFRRRRQWTQERNRRKAKARNSTVSNSQIPLLRAD
ncbi:PREDICTED: group 3 secretory phospholipase A2 [Nanorana parkeri]|uniref:group 3 secretory phospholipase A2 n=1 Tax=Nanorana parkeri TaxID=125878 RepID=UPI000854D4C1|nr:PREDICTED: group 3 secretory phospholipase A2 [Nanorana parkeri]